ncbi:hypothetical protein DY000_02041616 [Brassica cretica]|uniref:Tryptophanyl-tRNA synthetase n=1 Tax=Brassica cretica TaxID=69181 RepID=A0ABQ7BG95_BRACR|nr:hypothetical protein DY000_02041616 [Brassica cretica]
MHRFYLTQHYFQEGGEGSVKIGALIDKKECKRLGRENVKDIIACGFDVTKTFIFSDYAYVGG